MVFIDEAPLHFQYKIFTQGKMIFSCNQEKSLDFQEHIFNLYRDQKYFIDEFFKGVLESAYIEGGEKPENSWLLLLEKT